MTCSAAVERPRAVAVAPPDAANRPLGAIEQTPSPPLPEEGPETDGAEASALAPSPRAPTGPLPRIFAALADLEAGRRAHHVRIAWLGDSHAAADFWTGATRDLLQKRFGDGGPGYVNVGYRGSRHDGVGIDLAGKWALRPSGPSTTRPTADGVFGLGGVLARMAADSPRATVHVTADSGSLVWDVCARLGPNDELAVALDGRGPARLRSDGTQTMFHHRTTSAGPASLTLAPAAGEPQLCGVVIERDAAAQPGVVLDQLGINGGRFGTALAWNELAWGAELARRSPELVVLAYGTNEAGDLLVDPQAVARQAARLVGRVRRLLPQADCALVAPTDRADRGEPTSAIARALREQAAASSCWFFDTLEVMGGRGSIARWQAENPPRAAKDGIHMTARGYKYLGQRLGLALLDAYDEQASARAGARRADAAPSGPGDGAAAAPQPSTAR